MTNNEQRILDAAEAIENVESVFVAYHEKVTTTIANLRAQVEAAQNGETVEEVEDISQEMNAFETSLGGLKTFAQSLKDEILSDGEPTGDLQHNPVTSNPTGLPVEPTPLAGQSGPSNPVINDQGEVQQPSVDAQQPGTAQPIDTSNLSASEILEQEQQAAASEEDVSDDDDDLDDEDEDDLEDDDDDGEDFGQPNQATTGIFGQSEVTSEGSQFSESSNPQPGTIENQEGYQQALDSGQITELTDDGVTPIGERPPVIDETVTGDGDKTEEDGY